MGIAISAGQCAAAIAVDFPDARARLCVCVWLGRAPRPNSRDRNPRSLRVAVLS